MSDDRAALRPRPPVASRRLVTTCLCVTGKLGSETRKGAREYSPYLAYNITQTPCIALRNAEAFK